MKGLTKVCGQIAFKKFKVVWPILKAYNKGNFLKALFQRNFLAYSLAFCLILEFEQSQKKIHEI